MSKTRQICRWLLACMSPMLRVGWGGVEGGGGGVGKGAGKATAGDTAGHGTTRQYWVTWEKAGK